MASIVGLGILFALPREYTAHTIMVVAPRQPDLATTDQVAPPAYPPPVREPDVESDIQLMKSNQALVKIIRELQLDRDARFQVKKPALRAGALALLSQRWQSLTDGDWHAVLAPLPDRWDAIAAAGPKIDQVELIADNLGKRLKIWTIGKSTTVDIAFTASDPVVAAKVANAVAENYIEARQAARLEQAQAASRYLKKRSEQLLAQVEAAEKSVERFRASNVLGDSQDIGQLQAEMEATNVKLAAARIQVIAATTKLEAAQARVKQFGLAAALDSGNSRVDERLREMEVAWGTELAGTLASKGTLHPNAVRVEKQYGATKREVDLEAAIRLDRLRSDVSIARKQAALFEASLTRLRADFDKLSAGLVDLRALERRASVSRTVYEAFLNRLKRTEQVGFNEASGWVISPATGPLSPTSPKVIVVLGAILFAAAGLALSFALAQEHRDNGKILSSQHIAGRGLKALGIVPNLHNRKASLSRLLHHTVNDKASPFAESMGSIFTSVMQLAHLDQSSLVILITSALPFEGKSTTAVALAGEISSAGKRVLLVDADLRSPRLHRAFDISTARGLTECLDPSRDPNESIHVDKTTGISVLTAGPPSRTPQNTLRSHRLYELLELWRLSYDFIVIDSPPVLPISDARILVPLTDYCIFVTRWRKTRWTVAAHALSLLRDAGARLAGVVIAKVDVKQMAKYEFADSEAYGQAYKQYHKAQRFV
jgi:capsular exopolysaccharide synthesis family protein